MQRIRQDAVPAPVVPEPQVDRLRLKLVSGASMRRSSGVAIGSLPKPVATAFHYAPLRPGGRDGGAEPPAAGTPASAPTGREDMPEVDIHTAEGALRRDVMGQMLDHMLERLHALAANAAISPAVPQAARRAHHEISTMRDGIGDLATPGLDLEQTARLATVLRQARKGVCPAPSLWTRLWARLAPRRDKEVRAYQGDALLEMMFKHAETQALGSWAALLRPQLEARQFQAYADYGLPGTGKSGFLGGSGMIPVVPVAPGVFAGPVLGATIKGKDLGACDDGGIEQSRWNSVTAGAGIAVGIDSLGANATLSGTVKRKKGKFFDDVAHLIRAPEGRPYKQRISGAGMRRLRRALAGSNLRGRDAISLRDLDALQSRAYAERDVFAKVVGPVLLDGCLHLAAVERRPVHAPAPVRFRATTVTGSAGASAGAGLPLMLQAGIKLTGEYSLTRLTGRTRIGFWKAVGNPGLRDNAAAAQKTGARVAALRNLQAELEPVLRQILSAPGDGHGAVRMDAPFSIDNAEAKPLHELLERMNYELDRYCYAWRQIKAGIPRHAAQARAIELRWGARGREAMYGYLQKLSAAHALVGLRLQALGHGDDPMIAALARKLEAPDMTAYDRGRAERYLAFSDETTITEHRIPVALAASAGLDRGKAPAGMTATAAVQAAAEACIRHDSNSLRSGHYLRLAFDVAAGSSCDAHIAQVGQFLGGRVASLGLDASLLRSGMEAASKAVQEHFVLGLTGGVRRRVTLCYYRPAGGSGAMHLQYARVTRTYIAPVKEKTRLMGETLGTDTLSYLLMRHHAFLDRPQGMGRPYWRRFCEMHACSIGDMLVKLADPSSVIHAEAMQYWEQAAAGHPAGKAEQIAALRSDFCSAMAAYADDATTAHYERALAALEDFAQIHMHGWRQVVDSHVVGQARIARIGT